MQCVSRLLRATPLSSTRSFFSTPPCSVYPTKPAARSFSVTSPHCKFVVPKRKQQVNMPSGDMTTFKGKPFDRASLESVMKVPFPLILSLVLRCAALRCAAPHLAARRVILTLPATTLLHARLRHLRWCLRPVRLWPARHRPHQQHCRHLAQALCSAREHAGG